MCLAIEKIRFCTCKDKDLEDVSLGKWIYYRGEKNFDSNVVGMIVTSSPFDSMLAEFDNNAADEWMTNEEYSTYFASLLEKNALFDFDIQFEEGDQIQIKLKNRIYIELFFTNERWSNTDHSSPFRRRSLMMKGKAAIRLRLDI
ncbi:MAG TPA: hypothetical protein DD666_09920 [Advenella kashmirensis]|uniref:Uncharacterized protein n=1 Tax=Advenella kashmirensis TaxID=310575 RepID=A0A356LFW3_9BURK|nr:hypothetical protein [Advenella kashmirensis]